MRPPHLEKFDSLCGVPVHWGRWGRTGNRWLDPTFKHALQGALHAVFNTWHGAPPDAILSGGAYVPKPGRHRFGTAFDLSGFGWHDGREWVLAQEWRRDERSAIAIEAILRRHIPQCLGPKYDKRHRDHWHVDDRSTAMGFSRLSGADVRYLQWALNVVWRPANARKLVVDGRWGPETARAATNSLDEIGQPPLLGDGSVWRTWLRATTLGGFGLVEGE